MKIELTYEQEDQVIIKSLKRHIKYTLKVDDDPHETPLNKLTTLTALLRALEYYLAPSEFDTFVRKNNL